MANALNWFEIPVSDFQRAKKFYETILSASIYEMQMGSNLMGFLPMGEDQKGVGGALVKGEGYEPSATGSLVYLNAQPDLSPALSRVEEAGGKILSSKSLVREDIGYIALFMDTEGNKVALHSMH